MTVQYNFFSAALGALKPPQPGVSQFYFATGILGHEVLPACLAPQWIVQPFERCCQGPITTVYSS